MFEVHADDLAGEQVKALLAVHFTEMHSASPPGSAFALDLAGLRSPQVTVWTAWRDERLAAVGALKMLGDATAEVKSMRTHSSFMRMGAGAAILDTIIAAARARRLRRVSLETGSGPAFEPALALYRKRGFINGDAFAQYRPSAFNQFLHLDL